MLIFVVIIVLALLFPYILYVIRRMGMLHRIKKVCKEKGYLFHPTHKLLALSRMKDSGCDFHIKTPDTVYSVKMCGVISKKIYLNFISPTYYEVKSLRFKLTATVWDVSYKQKEKQPYNFSCRIPQEYSACKIVPIILFHPMSHKVSYSESGERKHAGNGDSIGEGILYSGRKFAELLMNSEG